MQHYLEPQVVGCSCGVEAASRKVELLVGGVAAEPVQIVAELECSEVGQPEHGYSEEEPRVEHLPKAAEA